MYYSPQNLPRLTHNVALWQQNHHIEYLRKITELPQNISAFVLEIDKKCEMIDSLIQLEETIENYTAVEHMTRTMLRLNLEKDILAIESCIEELSSDGQNKQNLRSPKAIKNIVDILFKVHESMTTSIILTEEQKVII